MVKGVFVYQSATAPQATSHHTMVIGDLALNCK